MSSTDEDSEVPLKAEDNLVRREILPKHFFTKIKNGEEKVKRVFITFLYFRAAFYFVYSRLTPWRGTKPTAAVSKMFFLLLFWINLYFL